MMLNQEKMEIKWEKKEWFFIFSFLIFLVALNIIFVFINWLVWQDDKVTIITTITTIFNLTACLGYWFIMMRNKFKKVTKAV